MTRKLALMLCLALSWPLPAMAQLRATDGLAALDAGDSARAIAIWRDLAGRGDVLALHNLGVLALQGTDGLDRAEAEGFLKAAAEAGHPPAQALLGDLLLERQDWTGALVWLERAGRAGEGRAAYLAGQIVDQGLAGPVDPDRARALYLIAAQNGLAVAQAALGALLLDQGAVADAAQWLGQAADQGQMLAQFNLARLLARGDGVAQDEVRARALYLHAARAGLPQAMVNLSLMQARGQGGPAQFRRALAWAMLAARAGDHRAPELEASLRSVMDSPAQDAAEALAGICMDPATPDCD